MRREANIMPPPLSEAHVSDEAMTERLMYEGIGKVECLPDDEVELPSSAPIEWENDSDGMRVTTKVPSNLRALLDGNWKCHRDDPNFNPDLEVAASACTPAALEREEGDIEKADNRCLRRLIVPRERLVPLVLEMAKVYPKSSIQLSGMFLYPKDGGYMGWHTNSDAPCTRVYITHVEEGEKSFFRYRLGGEYVTSWDKTGWNLRQFEVTKEQPLWHCVYAEVPRLSVGFRINRNLL